MAGRISAHALAELPNEACGLLSGRDGLATTFYPARNRHRSPLRFDVDPPDLVRIMTAIQQAGEELVAIFHSHVSAPAVPSPTDIRQAMYPDALHLLASLADTAPGPGPGPGPGLRAWRIRDGQATEVSLQLV